MKRTIKKLSAIVMAIVVLAGVIPFAALEGIFKFNLIRVEAAEADPFDTSKLTVVGGGKCEGTAWTLYNNGLIWVVDDTSGETSYPSGEIRLTSITGSDDFKALAVDVVYVYWNITAQSNSSYTFCNSPQTIKIIRFGTTFINTSTNMTDTSRMFSSCSAESIEGLEKLNTSNVTNMRSMFFGCESLTNINVNNFDTSKVTNMSEMFFNCTKLTSLNISNFDTSKVTYMNSMFADCFKLTSIDVSGFDTSNVTYMNHMFYYCKLLANLNVSNFDTSKVTDMNHMFDGCELLTNLDVSSFDTSKVTNMSYMFNNCKLLTELDVSGFNTSNVTDMKHMFYQVNSLKVLDLGSFDIANVTSKDYFISGYSLHYITVPENYTSTERDSILPDNWYELSKLDFIYRNKSYRSLPSTGDHSIEIVRDVNHECDNVTDGIDVCSICNVSIMFGDNNDDGRINISDAVILKKYLAGDTTTMINEGAANVNADAKLSVEDAVKLMKKLAGMDVELGVAD